MASKANKIAILGGGNIGMAIAQGLMNSGSILKEHITITRMPSQSLSDIKALGFNATYDNDLAIRDAAFVLVAVQPRQAGNLLKSIKDKLKPGQHTIISVVSALHFDEIEKVIGKGFTIVRIMPNTAIAICESITCLASVFTTVRFRVSVKVCHVPRATAAVS